MNIHQFRILDVVINTKVKSEIFLSGWLYWDQLAKKIINFNILYFVAASALALDLHFYRPYPKYGDSLCLSVHTPGVPTLARGYLPWMGVPTLASGVPPIGLGGYPPWMGVPTLARAA